MIDRHVTAAVLPAPQHEQLLDTVILPAVTAGAAPQRAPVAVFVAGLPGSGKSTFADLLQAAMDRRGGAARVSRDLYKATHPDYGRLLGIDDRTAGVRVRPDVLAWQERVEEAVRRRRFDAIVETSLGDPDQTRRDALAYRAAGFRIEVVVLAAPPAVAQLSVLDRYLAQVRATGAGRYVSWDNLEGCGRGLPRSLELLEAERLADQVMVLRRADWSVLYRNERTGDGSWRRPPAAHRAVMAEQQRPWTGPETWRFRRALTGAQQRLHPMELAPGRRLTVAGGLERAFALAEPVRRGAQPLDVPPGVDYHRLSADEHRFVFTDLIVPMYLTGITPQEHPVALYVMGAPGAGKTRAARTLRRALRARLPTRIEGGMFKALHPDYRRLLAEEPRTASARIRADYQAWQEQSEDFVREWRGDVLIEIAPGSAGRFLQGAARYKAAGYRVELVVLGVRAADSRLGTAARYAEVARAGGAPRFTSVDGHDTVFAAVTTAVRAAESASGVVDSITVIRRGLTALYRNSRTPGGAWVRAPRAAQVLAREQQRPYTPGEAARLLAALQVLRRELPQFRSDLLEIAALARTLMPADLLPRPLGSPSPPANLPALPFYRPSSGSARAA